MTSFRRIRSFIAVFEEGSFTAAAEREGATQSGVSQHVRQLEDSLETRLFDRDGRDVRPTVAGRRYYEECVAVLRRLEIAEREMRLHGPLGGTVRVGLMPTFTRVVLAPALERFITAAPAAEVHVTEAYSGVLTDLVLKGDLDFAVVPGAEPVVGLTSTLVLRDREMLITAKGRTGRHLEPVRLSEIDGLRLVLPGLQNARRRSLETYFTVNGIAVDRRLELDAMMGTLAFVETSDWAAVLPWVMMARDVDGARFEVRPIADPPLFSDFVLIEPARRAMTAAARLFADFVRDEAERTAALRRDRTVPDPAQDVG